MFRVSLAARLLFCSGLCALVYQVAWQREFRLIFGVSTAATSAVLAIFAGGLGLGSALLGRRADRHPNPLALYGRLEAAIALTAAVTPFLLDLVRHFYFQLGGSAALGTTGSTAARLLLASLVLAAPTVLMGGTLPAMARAIEDQKDRPRTGLGVLYGVNTMGAVTGVLLSTFWTLEFLGVRTTLWTAAVLNLAVAVVALKWSRGREVEPSEPRIEDEVPVAVGAAGGEGEESWQVSDSRGGSGTTSKKASRQQKRRRPGGAGSGTPLVRAKSESDRMAEDLQDSFPHPALVLMAAGVTGFVFFLMEMVWYRMLGPLLGGSVYTFGLILAMALLGVGLGSLLYSVAWRRRPSQLAFAITCLLESVFLFIPYAVGDSIALWTLQLRSAATSFPNLVGGWLQIAAVTVLAPALVAGFQFPLLVSLLGRQGDGKSASHVGNAYAVNTLGAILGSLAGGFYFLPMFQATGCWILAGWALVVLGVAMALAVPSVLHYPVRLMTVIVLAATACVMALKPGPSVVWRHSAIGAGLEVAPRDKNEERDFVQQKKRTIPWQQEGIESSVAMETWSGNALVVNGKIDGNVIYDAATTIMSGVLGPVLRPQIRNAMVIGLGVGSTAGWLATMPGIERVDVVELEPAVVELARACEAGTENCLANPKVKIHIADAREMLLVDPRKYDVIFSEPSNPYRAGIASLFTQEYYEAARKRLTDDGVFMQWVQSYQVSPRTVETVYATLSSVFPYVETWQLKPNDCLLVASHKPIEYDGARMRAQLAHSQVQKALRTGWDFNDLEGFLSHYVGGHALAKHYAERGTGRLNTDDRTRIEFECARTLGTSNSFQIADVRAKAEELKCDRPPMTSGGVDWNKVADARLLLYTTDEQAPPSLKIAEPEQEARRQAQLAFLQRDFEAARKAWAKQKKKPTTPLEKAMMGISYADAGDGRAELLGDDLLKTNPGNGHSILARYYFRKHILDEATSHVLSAFATYRQDPWATSILVQTALNTATLIVEKRTFEARRMFDAVEHPFSLNMQNENRLDTKLALGVAVSPNFAAEKAWRPLEPNFRWQLPFLQSRFQVYSQAGDPLAMQAGEDVAAFLRVQGAAR